MDEGFQTARELVAFIRAEFGDWFGIGVSGYPEGHVSCVSLDQDIAYLKEKVDAGADFIITQLFYDVDLYLQWLAKIRAAGVLCPVIPGIMPIQNYNGFMRMTSFCKVTQRLHSGGKQRSRGPQQHSFPPLGSLARSCVLLVLCCCVSDRCSC